MAQRVLFACEVAQVSGAEIVLLNLLAALDRSRYEPHAICPPDGPLPARLAASGVAVTTVRLPRLRRTARSLLRDWPRRPAFSRWLHAHLRERQIDLLHANSFGAHLSCGGIAQDYGIPTIWHMHDILRRRWPNGHVLRGAAGRADRIICVSHAVADELAAWGLATEKLAVIYNGLDPAGKFQPRTATGKLHLQFGLPAGARLVGMIGQITAWKGQDVFIRAAGSARNDCPDAVFVIVGAPLFGDRDYEAALRRAAAEAGVGSRVIFAGRRDDIAEVMSELDVVVHASVRPDALPTVLLEAGACGKPVVASHCGGVPEIVDDGRTGLLVPPGDAEAMAAAIVRLLDNPPIAHAMGAAARSRVTTVFSIAENVRKVHSLYDEMLGRPPLATAAPAGGQP